MATIAKRQQNTFPRNFVGLALTAILFAAAGSSVGWAIGHQTRSENRSATAVQSVAQPAAADLSVANLPVAPSVPADSAAADVKGGMAEEIEAGTYTGPVAGGTTDAPVIQVEQPGFTSAPAAPQ